MLRSLFCAALPIPALLAFALLAGCEPEQEITEQNVIGTWEAPLNEVLLTLDFRSNGGFSMAVTDRPEGGPGALGMAVISLGGWSNYAYASNWRLAEDEIVLSDYERQNIGGLPMMITELKADSMTIQLGDKAPIIFTRSGTSGGTGMVLTPPLPTTLPADAEETEEEAEGDEQ